MTQPANLAGNPVARMQLSEMRGIIIVGIPDSHQLRPGKFVFGIHYSGMSKIVKANENHNFKSCPPVTLTH